MKKINESKTTKAKPRKKATKPRRKPQTKLKNRKRGMKPVEMWVLVATLLLVVYLVTHVRTPKGVSFMTTMIEEVNHEGN